jgi:hypothetical protein
MAHEITETSSTVDINLTKEHSIPFVASEHPFEINIFNGISVKHLQPRHFALHNV